MRHPVSAIVCQSATANGHLQKAWNVSSGSKAQSGLSEDTSSPILCLFCQVGKLFDTNLHAKLRTVGGTSVDQINHHKDLFSLGFVLLATALLLCASSKAISYELLTENRPNRPGSQANTSSSCLGEALIFRISDTSVAAKYFDT